MALSFYAILTLSRMNDIIALKFHVSLNATTWMGRIGLIVVPPIAYFIAYRWALSLQRSDREVLAHGIETGIITRLPKGEYIELHQPLGRSTATVIRSPPLPGCGSAEADEQARLRRCPGTGSILSRTRSRSSGATSNSNTRTSTRRRRRCKNCRPRVAIPQLILVRTKEPGRSGIIGPPRFSCSRFFFADVFPPHRYSPTGAGRYSSTNTGMSRSVWSGTRRRADTL